MTGTPFPSYEAIGGDATGVTVATILFNDYLYNHTPVNPGIGTWFCRVFHTALDDIATNGTEPPVAFTHALERHRKDWVDALGGIAAPIG